MPQSQNGVGAYLLRKENKWQSILLVTGEQPKSQLKVYAQDLNGLSELTVKVSTMSITHLTLKRYSNQGLSKHLLWEQPETAVWDLCAPTVVLVRGSRYVGNVVTSVLSPDKTKVIKSVESPATHAPWCDLVSDEGSCDCGVDD